MAGLLAFVLWAAEAVSEPSSSDSEVRLVMALLIAVAAVALLGTLVYWVRTGDRRPPDQDDSLEAAEPEDTLG